ncbi:PspC domain-containing protein [Nocardia jejuensis]|uniref:PspC domain-containing protein n=1 Tax=Nocardia jejuensis TaxID=328049 RepID=UPI00082D0EBB|nr:PspC domain-containing protein [Nocardia jejuensis]
MTRTSDWSRGTGRAGFGDQIHDMWRTRPVRLPQHGPIAGVAAGFGRRYNVDPVVVRVAFVVSALFGGAGFVLYLLGWLLFTQQGDRSSAAESLLGKGQSSQGSSKTIVLMVALGIAVSTVGPVGVGLGGSGAISFALMLAGWWLLHQRQPEPPAGYLDPSMEGMLEGAYPSPSNPFWTGYPGTGPFDTYGPHTKLPDHYEPDPSVQAQQQQFAEAPTEAFETPVAATESDTAVLKTEPADTAVPREATAAQDDVASTRNAAGPVSLDKAPGENRTAPDDAGDQHPATAELAAIDGKEPVAPDKPADTTALDKADGPPAPEANAPRTPEPRTLHRIPPSGDRAYTGYGPAPISPDFGPTPPGWDPFGVAPLAWDLPEPTASAALPVQAPPQRPRSRFTPVFIGTALLVAAAAGSVAASGVEWMTPARIGAAALAVIAFGLILGAFLRRGYGLMVILAPLAGFVILASLIGPIEFDEGAMGDQTWSAATAADLKPDYHVSMGSATLDLSRLALTEDHAVAVSVNMGEAKVVLPPDLRVNTTCHVRMGDSNCVSGMSGPATGPVLNLKVDVQMGNAEVKRD